MIAEFRAILGSGMLSAFDAAAVEMGRISGTSAESVGRVVSLVIT